MLSTTITDTIPQPVDTESLKAKLHRAERINRLKSFGLILPLIIFLIVVFLVPLVVMLKKSVDNPEVAAYLPATVTAMADWDGKDLPPENVYQALAADIETANNNDELGNLGKRLNSEISGYRSLLNNTADSLPLDPAPESYKQAFIDLDERWGDATYWQAMYRNSSPYTPNYLLSSLDLKKDQAGAIVKVSEDQAIYQSVFVRTFWMSLVITAVCLVLAYPLAYLLATLPARSANLLMICVLLPFWTSVLVRVAAWIVLLQNNGLVNTFLEHLGLIDSPLQLVFNRFGVYVAMVHIMLPFMILPLYSVMKNIPQSYQRAAISLGCPPMISFWLVYLPQTYAGIGAGCLLVFILSIGYYITPALLGSPTDQMVSYFVAFYTNTTINWGMATALGGLLLLATLILYVIYSWLVGANRLRLG
ncbi:binding-protein-dependent transport systems inner membrane component [Tolumonas auensis DSM 9187]|uniref:Binding-protein-dependent transport systems inner membrane component n=1 Tax=Tolumonas auensis (strain DSM 9187 / NBRC 110442 / TA 4) TaxID=595494 RepID=C4LDE0_TOLAT|nr:ABC transporter permease [Tolumonas auensis]ACQ92736.1 binding-protein-dependent transport systems inner membrane component [Tolumonas auensis DSM 9187]